MATESVTRKAVELGAICFNILLDLTVLVWALEVMNTLLKSLTSLLHLEFQVPLV